MLVSAVCVLESQEMHKMCKHTPLKERPIKINRNKLNVYESVLYIYLKKNQLYT